MTKLLEQAIEAARKLTEAEQDELAEMLLASLDHSSEPFQLDDDARAAIEEGLAEAERGEFVPDEEMEEFFRRHGA
jgi:predicted transcriptional regulator